MPYIGHSPTNAGSFIELDDFGSSFDGSESMRKCVKKTKPIES